MFIQLHQIMKKKTLYQKLYNTAFYFAEKKSGIPYMISPGKRLCGVASPDWGTAVVQLPWFTYLFMEMMNLYEFIMMK